MQKHEAKNSWPNTIDRVNPQKHTLLRMIINLVMSAPLESFALIIFETKIPRVINDKRKEHIQSICVMIFAWLEFQ